MFSRPIRRVLRELGIDLVRPEYLEHLRRRSESLRKLTALHEALGSCRDEELEDAARFFSFCMANYEKSRAQLLQDLFVLYSLQKKAKGFFVECGAGDGVSLSNTFLLEREYGWSGVLVEPARVWHEVLRSNRSSLIENDCLWSESGARLAFNETRRPELSTIDSLSACDDHHEARRDGRRYLVNTISLNDLLRKHDAPRVIDFLSLDTEGSEYEILSRFDFDHYDVKVLTVEHNYTEERERINTLLSSMGFRRKFQCISYFDDWYVSTSVSESSSNLPELTRP